MAQEIEKVARMVLLVDFYGQLLTDKQGQAMELYYDDDLSLGEIAQSLDISRQAVHDLVKRSGRILEEYEEKLGLAARHLDLQQDLTAIQRLLREYSSSKEEVLLTQATANVQRVLDKF